MHMIIIRFQVVIRFIVHESVSPRKKGIATIRRSLSTLALPNLPISPGVEPQQIARTNVQCGRAQRGPAHAETRVFLPLPQTRRQRAYVSDPHSGYWGSQILRVILGLTNYHETIMVICCLRYSQIPKKILFKQNVCVPSGSNNMLPRLFPNLWHHLILVNDFVICTVLDDGQKCSDRVATCKHFVCIVPTAICFQHRLLFFKILVMHILNWGKLSLN